MAWVLERERELGRYASGRGAGLGRQIADDDDTTALTVAGAAILRGELAKSVDAVRRVLSFDDAARADVYLARARRFGVAVELLDRAAVIARWPAARELPIACGLSVPSDGVIDVKALLAIYAARARIVVDAAVVDVRDGRIATRRGELTAQVVVDASGAWAGRLTGGEPLDAFKRHLVSLELAAPGAPYWWHLGRAEVYARTDGAGLLASPCDETPTSPDDLDVESGRARAASRGARRLTSPPPVVASGRACGASRRIADAARPRSRAPWFGVGGGPRRARRDGVGGDRRASRARSSTRSISRRARPSTRRSTSPGRSARRARRAAGAGTAMRSRTRETSRPCAAAAGATARRPRSPSSTHR